MSTNANPKTRRTTMMPVTTMEEVPVVSEAERAKMIASLKAAETRVAAGRYVEHEPDAFVDRLMQIRADALRKKSL